MPLQARVRLLLTLASRLHMWLLSATAIRDNIMIEVPVGVTSIATRVPIATSRATATTTTTACFVFMRNFRFALVVEFSSTGIFVVIVVVILLIIVVVLFLRVVLPVDGLVLWRVLLWLLLLPLIMMMRIIRHIRPS